MTTATESEPNHYPAPNPRRAGSLSRAVLTLFCVLVSAASANADLVTIDNWRLIYMNGAYSSGGANENHYVYAVHRPRQENLLVHFDMSAYAGQTITGDASFSVTHTAAQPTNTMELYQLNSYNAAVDLDAAGSYYIDGHPGGTVQWRDNSGNALAHLNFDNAVQQISTLVDTQLVTAPTPGSVTTFTVDQQTVQNWVDGTTPSTLIMAVASNSPFTSYFLDTNMTLDFTATAVPEPSTFALVGFGLVCFGSRRRRRQT